ncbi:uncharacterized protein LOC126986013 [Eriocheir sinensis]|uniref:uncharacterized protein LOC126986013 n=1 Tax=Eriocheir sinensis TaxID=95602 RepID=UPI0021CAA864|nr:uncharacterized protein LOC126986013 [Eriocheir sinensis]
MSTLVGGALPWLGVGSGGGEGVAAPRRGSMRLERQPPTLTEEPLPPSNPMSITQLATPLPDNAVPPPEPGPLTPASPADGPAPPSPCRGGTWPRGRPGHQQQPQRGGQGRREAPALAPCPPPRPGGCEGLAGGRRERPKFLPLVSPHRPAQPGPPAPPQPALRPVPQVAPRPAHPPPPRPLLRAHSFSQPDYSHVRPRVDSRPPALTSPGTGGAVPRRGGAVRGTKMGSDGCPAPMHTHGLSPKQPPSDKPLRPPWGCLTTARRRPEWRLPTPGVAPVTARLRRWGSVGDEALPRGPARPPPDMRSPGVACSVSHGDLTATQAAPPRRNAQPPRPQAAADPADLPASPATPLAPQPWAGQASGIDTDDSTLPAETNVIKVSAAPAGCPSRPTAEMADEAVTASKEDDLIYPTAEVIRPSAGMTCEGVTSSDEDDLRCPAAELTDEITSGDDLRWSPADEVIRPPAGMTCEGVTSSDEDDLRCPAAELTDEITSGDDLRWSPANEVIRPPAGMTCEGVTSSDEDDLRCPAAELTDEITSGDDLRWPPAEMTCEGVTSSDEDDLRCPAAELTDEITSGDDLRWSPADEVIRPSAGMPYGTVTSSGGEDLRLPSVENQASGPPAGEEDVPEQSAAEEDTVMASAGEAVISSSSGDEAGDEDEDEVFRPVAGGFRRGLSRSWPGSEWGAWGGDSSSDTSRASSPARSRRPTGSLTSLLEHGGARWLDDRHPLCSSLADLPRAGRHCGDGSRLGQQQQHGAASRPGGLAMHSGWHALRSSVHRRAHATRTWGALREHVLEQVSAKRAVRARQDGGEGASEWPPRDEAPPLAQPPPTLTTTVSTPPVARRPPRFSEIFGSVGDVRAARRSLKDSLSVDKSLSLEELPPRTRRTKGRRRRGAEQQQQQQASLRYATPTAAGPACGAAGAAGLLEVVVAGLGRQETSPESGLGTSFEDSAASFSSSSAAASGSSSPVATPTPPAAAPRQVFSAISHYLCSVDLAESEDDSFNREAEELRPEDLLLMTDTEDTVTWRDLMATPPAHDPADPRPDPDDLELHFSAPPSPAPDPRRLPQELRGLLGAADFPLHGLAWGCAEPGPATPALATSTPHAPDPAGRDPPSSPDDPWPSTQLMERPHTPQVPPTTPTTPTHDAATPTTPKRGYAPPPRHVPSPTPPPYAPAATPTQATPTTPPTTPEEAEEQQQEEEEEGKEEEEDAKESAACRTDAEAEAEGRGRGREGGAAGRVASRERSVSCSDNIRAFLLSQPCAAAHVSDTPVVHTDAHSHACTDKHMLPDAVGKVEEVVPTTPTASTSAITASTTSTASAPRRRRRRPPPEKKRSFWSRLFCTAPMTVEGLVAPPPSDTPLHQWLRPRTPAAPIPHGPPPPPLPPPLPRPPPPPTLR